MGIRTLQKLFQPGGFKSNKIRLIFKILASCSKWTSNIKPTKIKTTIRFCLQTRQAINQMLRSRTIFFGKVFIQKHHSVALTIMFRLIYFVKLEQNKKQFNGKADDRVHVLNGKLSKGWDPSQQGSKRQRPQQWRCPHSSLLKHNLGVKVFELKGGLFRSKAPWYMFYMFMTIN